MIDPVDSAGCRAWMRWGLVVGWVGLGSCTMAPRGGGDADVDGGWERTERPHDVISAYYGDGSQVRLLIDELEDVAVKAKSGQRMGDGWVEVTFLDEGGRRLPAWLAGGKLIVEGVPGQPYRVEVVNTSDGALEVVVTADGMGLETGEEATLADRGVVMGPRGKRVFGGTDAGRDTSLRFRPVNGVDAVHRVSMTGTLGAVQLLLYGSRGSDVFELRPQPGQRRPGGRMTGERYVGRRIPYQYR